MGVVYFVLLVLFTAPFVLHIDGQVVKPPLPLYRNVNGLQSFCELHSWYSANTTLQEFTNPVVGADGTIYVIAGGFGKCSALLAFQPDLVPLWVSDCVGQSTIYNKLTVDDARGVLYYETDLSFSNGFLISSYNKTTGRKLWQNTIAKFNTTPEGYQYLDIDIISYYDLAVTGDIYLLLATGNLNTTTGDLLSYELKYNVVNRITGNMTLLGSTLFGGLPYNWTGTVPRDGHRISFSHTLTTSNPVVVTAANGTRFIFMNMRLALAYSYSYSFRTYTGAEFLGIGLYGFSLTNGTLAYYQNVGFDITPALYGQQPQLFADGSVLYFSVYLASADDLELVGYNYNTRSLLWRYPTSGIILTYSSESKLAYIIEDGVNYRIIDAAASDRSGSAVLRASYALDPKKAPSFWIAAIDAAGNLYGGNNDLLYKPSPSAFFVETNRMLVGSSQEISGLNLANNGDVIVVDQKSIRVYRTCAAPDLSLSGETIATIIIGALTFFFNFVDFILTKIRGGGSLLKAGGGGDSIGSKTKRWKVFLILFQVITTIIMTVLGAVSQQAVISDLQHLVDLLSDIPSFRDNYVVSQCSPVPGFNMSDMCFCSTPERFEGTLNIPAPMCNSAACPGRNAAWSDCNALVQTNCLCNLWFDQWSCGCNYPLDRNDTYCAGTTMATNPTLFQPKVAGAFDACYDHYHSILNLLWAVFGIHLAITTATIGIRLWSLNYLGSQSGKGGMKKLSLFLTICSLITTAALVIASVSVGLAGQVCTRPDEYDTDTIKDSRYIMDLFPGCAVNNQFYQLNLEGKLYDGVKTSLSVIGSDPGFSLLDMLHQIFS